MFDHVTIRANGRAESERFYDTVLAALGVDRTYRTNTFSEWREFQLAAADEEKPVSRHLQVGFVAPSREQVDEFWRLGTDAGYDDDGPPRPLPEYGADYYGAVLLDPDGNSVEAVDHGSLRRDGIIDHVWVRVGDVDAARRFYQTIAPYAGFTGSELTDRVQFSRAGNGGAFSLVSGAPTENLHWAFAADEDADVDGFHRAATEAGYRSNGPPGERRRYHPGHYAAYVLDPDGNNVEVVHRHLG